MLKAEENDRDLAGISRHMTRKGLAGKLGMKLVSVSPGHALVEMVPGEEDTNIFGTVHGGVVFALLDEAFQVSCNSHGTVAVALNVNVTYHRPAVAGRRLRAESREIHITKRTATYEIRVHDEEGLLIASSQALAYRKGERLPFLA